MNFASRTLASFCAAFVVLAVAAPVHAAPRKPTAAKSTPARSKALKSKGKPARGGQAKAPAGKNSAKAGNAKADADAVLRKACAVPKQRKTARCKAFAAAEADRAADRARADLRKACARKDKRKTKPCKTFLAAERKRGSVSDICGRKYGRARKNEKVAAFARRHRVAEGTVRGLNGLGGEVKKLRGGKRYLVYRSPHDGVVLRGGTLLEAEALRFSLQRPHRGWGKPLLVETLRTAALQVQASSPHGTHLVVGDLSKEGGGCLPPHRSHRGGLDADIGYYMRGGHQRGWLGLATQETLDADRTWQFLRGLLASGRLQYAFIDHGLQVMLYEAALRAGETPDGLTAVFQYPRPIEQAHSTIIRHLRGHADHMHVRFSCDDAGLGLDAPCQLAEPGRARLATVRLETRGGVVHEDRRGYLRRNHGRNVSPTGLRAPPRISGRLRASDAGVAIPHVMP